MSAINPEMESLKTLLNSMWMTGDFGQVAKHSETDAEEFIARLSSSAPSFSTAKIEDENFS